MENSTGIGLLDHTQTVVEYAAVATEVLAVAIILIGISIATYTYLQRVRRVGHTTQFERDYRQNLGRTLLLGLEVLVAADVVRTVAVDPSVQSAVVLGLLVLIRTFLSWSLVVEIENRWPWQAPRKGAETVEQDDGANVPGEKGSRTMVADFSAPSTEQMQTSATMPDSNAREIGRPG